MTKISDELFNAITLRELANRDLSEWVLGDLPSAALDVRYVPESVALRLLAALHVARKRFENIADRASCAPNDDAEKADAEFGKIMRRARNAADEINDAMLGNNAHEDEVANARLIAAAPELFKYGSKLDLTCSADALNPCWNGRPGDVIGKHWGGGDACAACGMRAAIAKALGKR